MNQLDNSITYSPTGNNEPADRAREVANWNVESARQQARKEGMEITDQHIRVLKFLRKIYVESGWPKKTHDLTQILDASFADEGGNKHLHPLFPGGPVAQGVRLAGLPTPSYAVDKSFGSSH